MDAASWALAIAVFAACVVESVEATTIVMAMGFTRSWRSALIYRSAGRRPMHDEEKIFREEAQAAHEAGGKGPGLDLFAFMVSLKGVFLEGVEVVFIVLTFGLSAGNVPVAVAAAAAAVVVVLVLAVIAHRPLSMIPENSLKFGVGLLLTAFGIFWSIEGLGILRTGRQSLQFPGADLAIVYFLAAAGALSWLLITMFRPATAPLPVNSPPLVDPEGSIR